MDGNYRLTKAQIDSILLLWAYESTNISVIQAGGIEMPIYVRGENDGSIRHGRLTSNSPDCGIIRTAHRIITTSGEYNDISTATLIHHATG